MHFTLTSISLTVIVVIIIIIMTTLISAIAGFRAGLSYKKRHKNDR